MVHNLELQAGKRSLGLVGRRFASYIPELRHQHVRVASHHHRPQVRLQGPDISQQKNNIIKEENRAIIALGQITEFFVLFTNLFFKGGFLEVFRGVLNVRYSPVRRHAV